MVIKNFSTKQDSKIRGIPLIFYYCYTLLNFNIDVYKEEYFHGLLFRIILLTYNKNQLTIQKHNTII